jgi:anti-sigma factor RsiW
MEGERMLAGLRCGEVLAELSESLDGNLNLARGRQLQEHVRACDRCAKLSGELSAAVHAIRAGLREPELDAETASRLRLRLKREISALG